MASQHGEVGRGSGEPYVMNVEHAENSPVMVEHSGVVLYTHEAHDINITTPILIFQLPILQSSINHKQPLSLT